MTTATKPRRRRDVELARIAECERDAARNFAAHKATPLFVGMLPPAPPFTGHRAGRVSPSEYRGWRCQSPKSWVDGFDLFLFPGELILTGDRGELVVQRARDMAAWCRSSIDDIGYFASKVSSEIETEEYSADMVRGWLAEIDAGDYAGCRCEAKLAKRLRDEATGKFKKNDPEARDRIEYAADDGEHAVYEALSDLDLHDDPPDFKVWTYSFLHQREAIKWFLRQGVA
jgi:hypothetical protein